jgi:hypothetical protein
MGWRKGGTKGTVHGAKPIDTGTNESAEIWKRLRLKIVA